MNEDLELGSGAVLSFVPGFDERMAWEAEQKGWFEGAFVTLACGVKVQLSFWDPVRLSQELTEDFRSGKSCFAEVALIIVPRITPRQMADAVNDLAKSGYFDRLTHLPRLDSL